MAFSPIAVGPMSVAVPVSRWPPVTSSPDPMVVAPSSASTHPDITGHRASRCDLYYRSRHGRRYDDRRWGHDNRRRNRDSDVDTETNPGIYSSDSDSCQGQNCDSLFHNIHPSIQFDALAEWEIVTTGSPICKKSHLEPGEQSRQTIKGLRKTKERIR